nr:hypothetical protein [Tanacetum cinerariifolium]
MLLHIYQIFMFQGMIDLLTDFMFLIDGGNHAAIILARCLCYKLQEKNAKKVRLSVTISEAIGDQIYSQTIFPLYVLLARQVSTPIGETLRSSSYQFKKAIKLTATNRTQAKFTLPDIKKTISRSQGSNFFDIVSEFC